MLKDPVLFSWHHKAPGGDAGMEVMAAGPMAGDGMEAMGWMATGPMAGDGMDAMAHEHPSPAYTDPNTGYFFPMGFPICYCREIMAAIPIFF